MQSLLLKLAMLTAAISMIVWIGWEAPRTMPNEVEAEPVSVDTGLTANEDKKATSSDTGRLVAKEPTVQVRKSAVGAARVGLLDLNRATAEDLQALPGIGPVLAQRVIEYRRSAGGFRDVEELRQVKGIGAKKFDLVRTLVSVAAPAASGKTENQAL